MLDIVAEVDSGSDATWAIIVPPPDQLQRLLIQRTVTLTSPSVFVAVPNVLSNIGGIFAFVDGIFSLIFGRTITATLFGQLTSLLHLFLRAH